MGVQQTFVSELTLGPGACSAVNLFFALCGDDFCGVSTCIDSVSCNTQSQVGLFTMEFR
jgi:hypothetical protein